VALSAYTAAVAFEAAAREVAAVYPNIEASSVVAALYLPRVSARRAAAR
jgi:hypothetical protein